VRRASRAWVVSAALGVLFASLAGCGYHVGGKGDLLPKTLHTIACPAFSNATTKYKLTGLLPQEIGREFTARTSYKVVADPKNADAVLEGVIAGYYAAPTVYDPATGRSSGVMVSIWLTMTLRERATNKALWTRYRMEVRERYEITADQRSYIDESDAALERMSRSVAQQVVSSILEAW
jgi:hypothetical protein